MQNQATPAPAVTTSEIEAKAEAAFAAEGVPFPPPRLQHMTDEEFDDIFNADHPNIDEVTWDEWRALFPQDVIE